MICKTHHNIKLILREFAVGFLRKTVYITFIFGQIVTQQLFRLRLRNGHTRFYIGTVVTVADCIILLGRNGLVRRKPAPLEGLNQRNAVVADFGCARGICGYRHNRQNHGEY